MIKQRRKLTQSEKNAIRHAWNNKCAYCRNEVAVNEYHIDHIVPKCAGGSCDIENLALSCLKCNSQKAGNRLPRMHEGLLLSTASRKAEKVRNAMKSTQVSTGKLLNVLISSIADTIDGYGYEIESIQVPIRISTNDGVEEKLVTVPLGGEVYEKTKVHEMRSFNNREDYFFVIKQVMSAHNGEVKRAQLKKEASAQIGASERTINKFIKLMVDEGLMFYWKKNCYLQNPFQH
jgi:hypothetical protein